MSESRPSVTRRAALGIITCPACGGPLKPDAKWCPACNFTGADSMVMFPEEPPPLLPVLDALGVLNEDDVRRIHGAMDGLQRGFPQFRWKICIVNLPPEKPLPVFGFWLLNACPFYGDETPENRAWTVLLLINAATGQAAAIPGYAAEPYVSDEEWKSILATMSDPWRAGKPADAIIGFLENTRSHLKRAWKSYGARHSGRKSS